MESTNRYQKFINVVEAVAKDLNLTLTKDSITTIQDQPSYCIRTTDIPEPVVADKFDHLHNIISSTEYPTLVDIKYIHRRNPDRSFTSYMQLALLDEQEEENKISIKYAWEHALEYKNKYKHM